MRWLVACVLAWFALACWVELRSEALVRLGVLPYEEITWREWIVAFVTAPWDFGVGFVRGYRAARGRRR